ncbi:MAG TPA: hypothetical protein VNW92_31540 [Polyangiaceae bacterium]|nr:hypothetical protein [Polyangiaceae bacterium]
MARVFTYFGFCCLVAAAAVCSACGQASLNPPEPPPRDVETRVVPQHKIHREIPRLIAPPPAYGNKVVMAHAGATTSVN